MEETIIKCDNCLNVLNDKENYIEVRKKDISKIIPIRLHFCNTYCLKEHLGKFHISKGE